MVPTGGAAGCGGARVVLYAHGTTTDRAYNIADITEPHAPAPPRLAAGRDVRGAGLHRGGAQLRRL
jgi:hypothetical protein